MNAWKDSFGVNSSVLPSKHSTVTRQLTLEVRFLSDPQGQWVKAAHLDWDASTTLGNRRGKRFVGVVDVPAPNFTWSAIGDFQDGVISAIFIEPDNAGLTITSADSVLASI